MHTAVWVAEAYAGLEIVEGALKWLVRYSPSADLHFQLHLRCDAPFEAIEDDPRFRSLLIAESPAGSGGC